MPQQGQGPPAYTPPGHTLANRIDGERAQGFGFESQQTAFWYKRSDGQGDSHAPLVAYAGPPGAPPLVGTYGGPTRPIDVGVAGVDAAYHDGIWTSGPGAIETHFGPSWVLHWQQEGVHSITARWSGGVYAVRGARFNGIGIDDLVKMIASFFAPGGGVR